MIFSRLNNETYKLSVYFTVKLDLLINLDQRLSGVFSCSASNDHERCLFKSRPDKMAISIAISLMLLAPFARGQFSLHWKMDSPRDQRSFEALECAMKAMETNSAYFAVDDQTGQCTTSNTRPTDGAFRCLVRTILLFVVTVLNKSFTFCQTCMHGSHL